MTLWMKPLSECRLYAFVDMAYLNGRSPAVLAQQLCDGGADLIQFRAKQVPMPEVRQLAEDVLKVTLRAGIPLVLNDYPQIAAEIGAPFCHLGQEDFFDAGHRHVSDLAKDYGMTVAAERWPRIGLSTHAPDQALRAVAAEPDYVAIGPVYPTGTKPTAKPVTLDYVRWAKANIRIPWFAIGGINLTNLDDVLAAGAQRICVVSAILNTPDVTKACRQFAERLGR